MSNIIEYLEKSESMKLNELVNFRDQEKIKELHLHIKKGNREESREFYQYFLKYVQEIESTILNIANPKEVPTPIKELIVSLISLKLKHKDLGIRQYLYYLDKDSSEYKKAKLISKIRSFHTLKELLNESDKILEEINQQYNLGIKGAENYAIEMIHLSSSDVGSKEFMLEKISKLELAKSNAIKGYLSKESLTKEIDEIESSGKEIIDQKEAEIIALKKRIQDLESNNLKQPKNDGRTFYQIDMIFGDGKSVRGYKRWINSNSGKEFIKNLGLNEKQFGIICNEFSEQKRLKIDNKMMNENVIIIAFETDHNTHFYENIRTNIDYSHRIEICDLPKQHFSISRMESMLQHAIRKYEDYTINSIIKHAE